VGAKQEKALFYFIVEPIVNMRALPDGASKVVSQALMGEEIRVCQKEKGWAWIQTPDGYFGWVPLGSFTESSIAYLGEETVSVTRLSGHIYSVADVEFGPKMTVAYGTRLKWIDDCDPRWTRIAFPNGEEGFIQKGDVAGEKPIRSKKDLISLGKRFLGLPYTWGGRSSFGYDCSGFVQMLYGRLGFLLPRDSIDQSRDARLIPIEIGACEPGDLLFFGKNQDRIQHVALFIGKGAFIHASSKENKPYLRISRLTDAEWSGALSASYPYRTARSLLTNGPEKEESHRDFRTHHHDNPVKMAIDKTFHALSPKRHGCSDKRKTEESREGHISDERKDPQVENSGRKTQCFKREGE